MRVLIIPALLALAPTLAAAQEPAPACPATPAPLPAELAGWAAPTAIEAADSGAHASRAALTPGSAVTAALKQTSALRYVVRPEKPGGSVSYGGLFAFTVPAAGTYRIALGSGAWIDVLRGRDAIASTSHGHGPECSGIRKMVDFPLSPGRYVLQVAANGAPTLQLLVARLP